MIRVRQNYEGHIVYFKFSASGGFDDCFWYCKTTENYGFELGKIDDYTPINTTWKEIKNNEKI